MKVISAPVPPRCFAYRDDGTICGQPGLFLDRQRGFYVCEEHGKPYVFLTCAVLPHGCTVYFPESWTRGQMVEWLGDRTPEAPRL